MIAPRLDVLPSTTQSVLAKLADEPVLAGFCLVGGTAMALQAGHHRSLDIDLVTFNASLNKKGLFKAMRTQVAALVTPQSMVSAAKINGIDLLALEQDYVLDGVKVQCFTDPHGHRHAEGVQAVAGWGFSLADLPTLFVMKSALLLKRSRSRNYFDLMWFYQHLDKTLLDIVAAAQAADDSPEVATLIEHKLLGLMPLDTDDEGLDPVGLDITPADIYRYFEAGVMHREVAQAHEILAKAAKRP